MGIVENSESSLNCKVCGSPFALTAKFCTSCGATRDQALGSSANMTNNPPPATEKPIFCTSCGTPYLKSLYPSCPACASSTTSMQQPPNATEVPASSPNSQPPVTKNEAGLAWPIDETPEPQEIAQVPKQLSKYSKNQKGMAIVAILLVVSLVSYQLLKPKFNFEATSLAEAVGGDQARVDEFINKNCDEYVTLLESSYQDGYSANSALDIDYSNASDYQYSDFADTFTNDVDDFSNTSLNTFFESKLSSFTYESDIVESFFNELESTCENGDYYGVKSNVADYLNELDTRVSDIFDPPANWEGSDFWLSDQDPNIAWKWASSAGYCGWADACNTIVVKTRLSCESWIDVTFDLGDSQGFDYAQDTVNEMEFNTPGEYGTISITGFHYGTFHRWWKVSSLTCGGSEIG